MITPPFSLDRLAGFLAAVAGLLVAAGPTSADGPFNYYALTPCRTVDTRYIPGSPGAPPLVAGNGYPALQGNGPARNFQIRGTCGIPTEAKAVSINLTVVTRRGLIAGELHHHMALGRTDAGRIDAQLRSRRDRVGERRRRPSFDGDTGPLGLLRGGRDGARSRRYHRLLRSLRPGGDSSGVQARRAQTGVGVSSRCPALGAHRSLRGRGRGAGVPAEQARLPHHDRSRRQHSRGAPRRRRSGPRLQPPGDRLRDLGAEALRGPA